MKKGIILYDINNVYILEKGSNNWKSFKIDKNICKVFVDELSKSHIYILCEDGNTYEYISEDLLSWTSKQIPIVAEGELMEIGLDKNNSLYFSVIPEEIWEEVRGGD